MTRDECLAILDLPSAATRDDIVKSYRQLVLVWHPDRFNSAELRQKAQGKLTAINEAYSLLVDMMDVPLSVDLQADAQPKVNPPSEVRQKPSMTPAPPLEQPQNTFAILVMTCVAGFLMLIVIAATQTSARRPYMGTKGSFSVETRYPNAGHSDIEIDIRVKLPASSTGYSPDDLVGYLRIIDQGNDSTASIPFDHRSYTQGSGDTPGYAFLHGGKFGYWSKGASLRLELTSHMLRETQEFVLQ